MKPWAKTARDDFDRFRLNHLITNRYNSSYWNFWRFSHRFRKHLKRRLNNYYTPVIINKKEI